MPFKHASQIHNLKISTTSMDGRRFLPNVAEAGESDDPNLARDFIVAVQTEHMEILPSRLPQQERLCPHTVI